MIEDLIAKLEKATGPNGQLDHDITAALWPGEPLQWPPQYKAPSEYWAKRPVEPYTASLDAALTLVPEGYRWVVESQEWSELRETYLTPVAYVEKEKPKVGGAIRAEASTPAIALCIAALKARP